MSSHGPWDGGAPPPVVPRIAQAPRGRRVGVIVVAVAAVAAVGAGAAYLLMRTARDETTAAAPSPTVAASSPGAATSAQPTDPTSRLMRELPRGYPAGACTSVARMGGALATVACTVNTDAGGPVSATYSLLVDKAALDWAVGDIADNSTVVDCPGRIQSPGPWRHNAAPQEVSGTLVCGIQAENPMLAWTDIDAQLFGVVQGRPGGPTLDHLYAWWTSHS